jgi:acyl carrier protein
MESEPLCATTQKLTEFVQETFPRAQGGGLDPDQNLLESGVIDSMGLLIIISFLEDELGIVVDDSEVVMDNFGTITAMARYVLSKGHGAAA